MSKQHSPAPTASRAGPCPSVIKIVGRPNTADKGRLVCDDLVGWLFWVERPFETIFQSISGRLQKRGRKRRKDR